MLKFSVYYQDFSLNARVFDENYILDTEKAVRMENFTLDNLRDLGFELEEGCPLEEIFDTIFQILNIHHDLLTIPRERYKRIGHTSMSIGDYVVLTDLSKDKSDETRDEYYICARTGWNKIPAN